MGCTCKVGACKQCSSSCGRCGCACDGIDPEVAKKRKRGQHGNYSLSGESKPKRQAKAKAVEAITASCKAEVLGETPARRVGRPVDPISTLWKFFGWTPGTRSSLPSSEQRRTDQNIKESNRKGWSVIVQSISAATLQVAKIIYPANPEAACHEACSKLLGKETASTVKARRALASMYQAAPKGSVEKRILRAAVVKAIPPKARAELIKDGIMTMGSDLECRGYKDCKLLAAGQKLESKPRKVQRLSLTDLKND